MRLWGCPGRSLGREGNLTERHYKLIVAGLTILLLVTI